MGKERRAVEGLYSTYYSAHLIELYSDLLAVMSHPSAVSLTKMHCFQRPAISRLMD